MTLRPFSDHERGLFISVDGPSGAGKSTVVQHLAQMLVAAGETVHVTAEPSAGPIGTLARELTETVTGHALACLYTADRYHHSDTEIRSHVDNGTTVISDRYIASGLVMQRFDGVDPDFLWQLNAEADRPDLAVILDADPEIIAQRLTDRGPHNRFQHTPNSSHAEVHFYRQATERLTQSGFNVLHVDCNQRAAHHCRRAHPRPPHCLFRGPEGVSMHPHEPDPVAPELDALVGAAQVLNTHTDHDAAPRPSGEVGTLVTGVDALTDGWATDPAVLKRLLGLLRSWGEPAAGSRPMTQRRHTAGHPEFGVACRRANLTDPIDITLPATLPHSDRPPVCVPAASFRRSVGPQTSESGSSHG